MLVASSIGPRILSFGFKDGENVFAELPNAVAKLNDGSVYHFYGGHRLWRAPEDLERTYIPDNSAVDISEIEHGLIVTKPTEPQTGLQKSMEIHLIGDSQVHIIHSITNRGSEEAVCAPWAITQFKLGGLAILPQSQIKEQLLPNRALVLWSYTDLSNPNVEWGNNFIRVCAQMTSPFKIGFPNPRGWLAYWLNGTLFVKHAEYKAQAQYYDSGSSSECYCNDQFLELETLGPISAIAPNATACHTETWNLFKDIDRPGSENEIQLLLEKLGLE